MLVQWIIVGIIVLGAGIYLARLIVRAFRSRGCPGCATMPRTRGFLKKRAKSNG